MADLPEVLPSFDHRPYSHLLHSLRKNNILVSDLISLDPIQIAKRCPLPPLDVQRLVGNVIETLQKQLNIAPAQQSTSSELLASTNRPVLSKLEARRPELNCVSTLDDSIDHTLGGGFPAGYLTEIVGERYGSSSSQGLRLMRQARWARLNSYSGYFFLSNFLPR